MSAAVVRLAARQSRTGALMDAEEELLRLAEDPALGPEYAAGLRLGASAVRRLRDSPVIVAAEPGIPELDRRPAQLQEAP
jgi:hypothetical protein